MYGKLFASTFTGSMRGSGVHIFAVWAYALATKDQHGFVELNVDDLVDRLGNCVAADIQDALNFLTTPDPDSRSADEDGRRLVEEGPYLYRVVNAVDYQKIKKEDDRREYLTRKQRERRARLKKSTDTPPKPEPDVPSELFPDEVPDPSPNRKKDLATVVKFYLSTHPKRRVVNETGRQKVRTRLAEGFTVDDLENAIRGNAMDPWHVDKGKHGLEYVLRNPDMVNDFIGKYEQTRKPRSRSDDLPLLNAGAE